MRPTPVLELKAVMFQEQSQPVIVEDQMTVDSPDAFPLEQVLQDAPTVGVTTAPTPRTRGRQWLALACVPIVLAGICVCRPLFESVWACLTAPSIREQETVRLAYREAAAFIEQKHATAAKIQDYRPGTVKQLADGYYRIAVIHEDRDDNGEAIRRTVICVVGCSHDPCSVEALAEGR
jgi:hypothetical protein